MVLRTIAETIERVHRVDDRVRTAAGVFAPRDIERFMEQLMDILYDHLGPDEMRVVLEEIKAIREDLCAHGGRSSRTFTG
jgi:hypothetical protein